MKKLHSNVRLRLILICILIGTFPAIIVGAFSYYKAADVIQEKVDNGNIGVLTQTKMAVEQMLLTSDHILWQFVQSPAVKEAITADMKGNMFGIFSNAEDAINSLPTYDLGISDICLVNFDKNWVMDNSGIYGLNDYSRREELDRYLNMPGYSFWINDPDIQKLEDSDSLVMTGGVSLVKKYPLFTSNPSVMVVMRVPYTRLSSLVSASKQLGDVVIIGLDGLVITHSDKAMWGGNLSGIEFVRKINESQAQMGNFTIKIDNAAYSVNYIRSDYNNWVYLSLTSLINVTRDSKAIGWFTLVICLVVIAVVNLIGFFISSRMYKPISKIYNMVLGIQDAHESVKQKDELGLIEERVNFLLKDQARLKKQTYSQFEQLKEFFILKLILNEVEEDIIETRVKLYGYPSLPDVMCLLVTRIDTLEGTQYLETDRDLMLFAVNNVIGELLDNDIILKPVVIDDYQITILGNESWTLEIFRDNAFYAASRIQEVVSKVLDFSVSIGISRPINGYGEIHRGFLEGIDALKHQIILGYNAIIFIQDISGAIGMKTVYPDELQKELLSAVKTCDVIKTRELLHRFIERIFMVEVSRHEYQFSLIRLLSDLAVLVKETGNSPDILIKGGKSVFEQLFTLKTAGEIEKWMDKFVVGQVIECFKSTVENQHKKILDGTLKIIREEYDTELTLEGCAARMNYHPSYIRRVLKNEAGISFSEYLSRYRMDMAKKWLIETELKISDIADKLQYRNPENFIRCFKKVEGITPGRYRENTNLG